MLRIALRVRLRFRSAQDDTEGEKSANLKEQSLRHGKPCHLPLHKGGGELHLLQKIRSDFLLIKPERIF